MRAVTRGALVNLCGDALDLLGVPLLYLFIGRFVGAEALGAYILVASYLAILLRFGVLGFDKAMLRFIPAAAARGDAGAAEASALGTAVRWAAGASALACAIAVLFPDALLAAGGDAGSRTTASWLVIMAFAVPAQALGRVLLSAMRGRHVMWAFVFVQSVVAPLSLVAASALPILLGGGPEALPWGFLASAVVTAAVAVAFFLREFSNQTIAGILRAPRDREVLAFSFPQGMTEAINFVMARVDIVMLAAFFPDRLDLVAFYGVASLLAGVVKRARVAFDNSFSPVFSRCCAAGDVAEMRHVYRATSASITSLFALMAGVLCFSAPFVLSVYGPDYAALWPAVPILVVGRLLNAAGGPAQAALLMAGRSKLELLNNAALCAVNVGLNWLLIPRFHVYGAAAASAITLSLLNLVRIVEVAHLLKIWTDLRAVGASLLLASGAALPGAAILFASGGAAWGAIAAAALFGIAYFASAAKYGRGIDLRRLAG